MFENLSNTVQEMSTGMIQDRLDLTEQELQNIFDPINTLLEVTRQRAEKGIIRKIEDKEIMNSFFVPIINNYSSVSSLLLANDQGDEYMLLKTDSLWITRITKKGSATKNPISYYWKESNNKQVIVNQKEITSPYDPRTRPWFKLAHESEIDTLVHWTQPYTFFTSQHPGITASIKWTDKDSGVEFVFALDVLISDLSEFTTTIDVTSNGKVFILSDEYKVIGLPRDERFLDEETRRNYSLKNLVELDVPVLNEAIDTYESRQDSGRFVNFRFNDENWWAAVDLFPLDSENVLYVGVVVPETDFSEDIAGTRRLLVGGIFLIILFFLIILYSFLKMKKANKIIEIEKNKNEQLLLNTLPIKVVNDLKENGKSDPQKFRNVTVCFSDIVGFTRISSKLDPNQLINELNDIYTAFDEIMIKHDCERIKTIGDAYLSVCGMPQKNERHAEMMLRASFEILKYIEQRNKTTQLKWQMRIGLHSGSVVGGIVGIKKYIYDVFGDTINTASRMEGNSEPMRVNISEETYLLLKDSVYATENHIQFEDRDPIQVKGKGKMNMYFASPKSI